MNKIGLDLDSIGLSSVGSGEDWVWLDSIGQVWSWIGLDWIAFRSIGLGWVRVRGVNSLAKHPERVGTGPKDKKRLQIQLTWQNRPNIYSPVPPLPGAREGRGLLELVEIFQIASPIFEKRRSVEVDVAPAGGARPRRRVVRTGGGITPLVCGFSCAGR